jgi:1,4-dihydroxy-2-naphthoyl-CoA hydrolase
VTAIVVALFYFSKISKMIWKTPPTLEALNASNANTMMENLGIEYVEVGDDYIIAKMPVDGRTVQPFRILHGGASVSLAESVGSVASICCIDLSKQQAVGLEINANHLSSAREGSFVFGRVSPIRIGKTIHVWQIDITDANGKKICVSRLTMAIVER